MDFNYCLNYNTDIGIIEIHITNIYHNLELYQYKKETAKRNEGSYESEPVTL